MPNEKSIGAARILQIAEGHGLTRAGLQAQVTAAEGSGEVERNALAAMRALLEILERAEASFAVVRDTPWQPSRLG